MKRCCWKCLTLLLDDYYCTYCKTYRYRDYSQKIKCPKCFGPLTDCGECKGCGYRNTGWTVEQDDKMYFAKEITYRLTEKSKLTLEQIKDEVVIRECDFMILFMTQDESVGLLHAIADMFGYTVKKS